MTNNSSVGFFIYVFMKKPRLFIRLKLSYDNLAIQFIKSRKTKITG